MILEMKDFLIHEEESLCLTFQLQGRFTNFANSAKASN